MASCGTISLIPGPQGPAGTNGTNGTNGVNAFTTLAANFTMPAQLATGSATVVSSAMFTPGEVIYLQGAGYLQITAIADSTHLTLKNLRDDTAGITAYAGNVAAGTIIASGAQVVAGGLQGPRGSDGAGGAPTTASYWTAVAEAGLSAESALNVLLPAGGVVQSGVGTGVPAQAVLCTAIEALAANGLVTRTAAATAAARTITGTAGEVVITNGDGVAGNPNVGLNAAVYRSGGTDVAVADGGTGSSTASGARTNLGLKSVATSAYYAEERTATGANGGTFAAGVFLQRVLTNEVYDTDAIGVLAAGQVNLSAGTYRMRAWGMAYRVNSHKIQIYNATAGAFIADGSAARSAVADDCPTISIAEVRVVLAIASAIEVRHQCQTADAVGYGRGLATGFGAQEAYAGISIELESP